MHQLSKPGIDYTVEAAASPDIACDGCRSRDRNALSRRWNRLALCAVVVEIGIEVRWPGTIGVAAFPGSLSSLGWERVNQCDTPAGNVVEFVDQFSGSISWINHNTAPRPCLLPSAKSVQSADTFRRRIW
jgi:hypothetical protein